MDWDADPQREAYQRAIGDYIEFAKIIHNYDLEARPPHDDIDYPCLSLDELDGIEFSDRDVAIGRIALVFFCESLDEDMSEPEPWDFFGDYDGPKRCNRRKPKDEE